MRVDFSTTVITYGWCSPTKANKTVLTNFYPRVRTTYASTSPFPLPVTNCHARRTPCPSLKRDVINEWPLFSVACQYIYNKILVENR